MVVRHKGGGGINRLNMKHIILYPVQVSGFEAHHGTLHPYVGDVCVFLYVLKQRECSVLHESDNNSGDSVLRKA